MADIAQKRADRDPRSPLSKQNITWFQVLGLDTDRALIRALARRLAEAESDATSIRAGVNQLMAAGTTQRKGRILDALRRSPLARANLDLRRAGRTTG